MEDLMPYRQAISDLQRAGFLTNCERSMTPGVWNLVAKKKGVWITIRLRGPLGGEKTQVDRMAVKRACRKRYG